MEKKTAVEHLQEYLTISLGIDRMRLLFNEFEKAKAIEKEQIMDASYYGHLKGWVDDGVENSYGEEYYNETFKSK